MKKRLIVYIVILTLLISGLLFYRYGRSIWIPVKLKIIGHRSVSDVLKDIGPGVSKKYKNISELINKKPMSILIFKEERRLEIWKFSDKWKHIKNFPFTAFSGKLGPKLRQGDRQIPEGIYGVEYLNPNSKFYLSFKVDYPNKFDRKKGKERNEKDLGGDIFIHGNNKTIGCVPVGDDAIEELFYIVAKNGRKNIRIVITPYDMRAKDKKLNIPGIDWEKELYAIIKKELLKYKLD